jgi:murein DD-endopeptidase MepM/ murein hydrolase activator NlpD
MFLQLLINGSKKMRPIWILFFCFISILIHACAVRPIIQDSSTREGNTPAFNPDEGNSKTATTTHAPVPGNGISTPEADIPVQNQAASELIEEPVIAGGTPTPITESLICSPLQDHGLDELPGIVSAPYDPPPPGKEERHHGVDFSYYRRGDRESILGVGVQSILDGSVSAVITDAFPYGNFVIVETNARQLPAWLQEKLAMEEDQSLYMLYAHLSETSRLTVGEPVVGCQHLGSVGKSGNAGIPHLHLEARIGPQGAVFDQMAYYEPVGLFAMSTLF